MRRNRVKYDNFTDIDGVILIERFLNSSAYLDSYIHMQYYCCYDIHVNFMSIIGGIVAEWLGHWT